MNTLLIHGVDANEDEHPYSPWIAAIANGLTNAGYAGVPNPTEMRYNSIFEKYFKLSPDFQISKSSSQAEIAQYEALMKLMATLPWNRPITNPELVVACQDSLSFGQPGPDILSQLRWAAGMAAQWLVSDQLRAECREILATYIKESGADVIFAYSIGSLICYDLLHNDDRGRSIFSEGTLITLGSQIGNEYIKSLIWGGEISQINVKQWTNLYNPKDPVFVAPINLISGNFEPLTTVFGNFPFDISAHYPTWDVDKKTHPGYLDNPPACATLYQTLLGYT